MILRVAFFLSKGEPVNFVKAFALFFTSLVLSQALAQGRLAPSFASSTQHEVDLSLSRISYESYKAGERNTDINVYAGYHYQINPHMQLGAEGGMLSVPDGADTKTVLAAIGLYTYNLESPIRESIYLEAGAGVYPSFDDDKLEYESQFTVLGGIGKRFEMWGKINYKPHLRVWKRGEEDMRFEVQLLNFSIFY